MTGYNNITGWTILKFNIMRSTYSLNYRGHHQLPWWNYCMMYLSIETAWCTSALRLHDVPQHWEHDVPQHWDCMMYLSIESLLLNIPNCSFGIDTSTACAAATMYDMQYAIWSRWQVWYVRHQVLICQSPSPFHWFESSDSAPMLNLKYTLRL